MGRSSWNRGLGECVHRTALYGKPMIKTVLIAGGVGCLAFVLLAQSGDSPVFRSDSNLKEISILAMKDGKPVLDLTKEDFRVRDNKHDAMISFFMGPQGSGGGLKSATEPGSAAIVLDWLNMGFAEKAYARQKTINMLKTIGLNDHVAIFANFRTLRLVHGFTNNNAALLESLTALKPDVDGPAESAIFGTRDDATFAALDSRIRADATRRNVLPIIELLRRQPGRKSLIWVSNAFYAPIADLVRANITVYTVDARGVETRALLAPSGNLMDPQAKQDQQRQDNQTGYEKASLSVGAVRTGGIYFEKRNDLDGAMREALAETHTSYTLGYYLPEDAKPGEHRIQIDSARRGVELRYRKTYTVERPTGK